jgi:hypothetical protein
MLWESFACGTSIGQLGSENGRIIRDDEYQQEARITLERDGMTAPFAITCGIYGWMFHTCFFSTREQADGAFDAMRDVLTTIVDQIPSTTEANKEAKSRAVAVTIQHFVERFP